jgi:hypothetical protein
MADMTAMSMSWLPGWVRAGWLVVLAAVALLHLRHVRRCTGQPRGWHLGHLFMTSGMILMYVEPMPGAATSQTGLLVFGVATCVLAGWTMLLRRRETRWSPLWIFTTADMAVMTYMFVPPAHWSHFVTSVCTAFQLAQALAWIFARWQRLAPAPAAAPVAPAQPSVHCGITAPTVRSVRLSLAALAVSMAYLLLSM